MGEINGEQVRLFPTVNLHSTMLRLNCKSSNFVEPYEKYRKQIIGIEEHFDPFLSYGHILKVKFTDKGIEKLEKSPHNRPLIINKNGNIYDFYCKEFNALIYFPPFFGEAEILEPLNIRHSFIEKLIENMNLYK